MAGLFWRQFGILVWKNWIVLSRHSWLNILRCFILPVAYGIFLAVAQIFLDRPNNYGIGSPVPIYDFGARFDGSLALVWTDVTNGTTTPSPDDIMARITRGFSSRQLSAVKRVDSLDDIPTSCPPNFNLFSECFAAVSFSPFNSSLPEQLRPVNYTIHADGGLFHIDVVRHTSDYETRLLPLQWALDSAIIDLSAGVDPPTPLEWPFTQETNKEQMLDIRLTYIRGLRSLLVLALFVCYVGIAYQLPGAFMGERANLITSHMKAMGLRDSARILSWHISMTLAYLPAWIIVSIIWHFRIFAGTNGGLIFVIHLLFGLSLASWSLFIAVPFGKSPQLAAVASTFCAILFAILAQAWSTTTSGSGFVYSIFFPPGYYIFTVRAIAGFEVHQIPTNILHPDPDNGLRILPFIIAAIVNIFLWPFLAVLLERRIYDARNTKARSWAFWRTHRAQTSIEPMPPNVAISIRNLGKDFQTSLLGRKKGLVTAVADLTLEIPKSGIYVLLGSNGAGKSTTMSILAGLLGRTRGTIQFEGGVERPPRGTIGIVPQKNVLFPELTCHQTLRVWRAIKRPSHVTEEDDIDQLLRDCDLGHKIHYNADALSGGQKRKLQLAIGLIGGSKIVLVDECTSGVDPLSRRSIWKTLTAVRHDRTIVFTTHFLDEADLLADTIAVLAAPGKLVAHGSPVHLKSTLGEGYTVEVMFSSLTEDEKRGTPVPPAELLSRIRSLAPYTYVSSSSPSHAAYHLKCKDPLTVRDILQLVESTKEQFGIANYSVVATSIEDIFLGLMHSDADSEEKDKEKDLDRGEELPETLSSGSGSPSPTPSAPPLQLTNGRRRSPFSQAFTIFHKRALVARRSWLTLALAVIIAVAGTCVPLFFLSDRATTCSTKFSTTFATSLYLPMSAVALEAVLTDLDASILASPPGILETLGNSTGLLSVDNIQDNATFISTIQQTFLNQSLGGISFDPSSGQALIAWEATPPGMTGLVLLNLASNVIYNHALNTTGQVNPRLIMANFEDLPGLSGAIFSGLKWLAFYGAAMAVYPAFFSLYVSKERRSSVQAMQLSNGLSDPAGLWLGHLMFDSIFGVIAATIIIIIFAAVSNQFHGLGLFWVVLVLYGITGTLFSYCVSLAVNSPLAAFAVSAGYQIIMFVLYIADYLLILTYAKSTMADQEQVTTHFTLSIASPVASALRAALVSVNLFSLVCVDGHIATAAELGTISKFGGPIAYLIVYAFILFGVLVWVDSGSILPRRKTWLHRGSRPRAIQQDPMSSPAFSELSKDDVEQEALAVSTSDDILRVLDVEKTFGADNKVVDDVSFGVSRDTIFALLGPNGAGKTTTFNIIRGEVIPDAGDVLINDISVIHHPRSARLSLGVCPQFTAIDEQLTVREHLLVYGRLKGLYRGEELNNDVENLMRATSLHMYADRLASKLSGGNQRKLSLAIALIGNPSCILIDEFSTGIDAKMKRDMWGTLRNVAVGKAIIITTHSMEEASALATKVGILARRMLVVGTIEELAGRYATYEVHFSCRTREEVLHAQELMSHIPGARAAEDVATRFEVPIGNGLTLADLFSQLASDADAEYAVERATLESVFLKVIRGNNIREEDTQKRSRWRRLFKH